jgi:hypothetical protein
MAKPKTGADLASLDADWPPRQSITLTDLIAEGPRRRLGFYQLVLRERP